MNRIRRGVLLGAFVALTVAMTSLANIAIPDRGPAANPRDWPMFGGTPARNMVNRLDKNLPRTWSIEKGKQQNIKWSAKVGNRTFGSPVVAGGRVFAASEVRGDEGGPYKAALSAFREADGKPLWQNRYDHPADFRFSMVQGIPSTPAVDGDRIYYMTPVCDVICADTATGRIHWRYDLVKELKVFSSPGFSCTSPPHASPLVVGEHVFVTTGNGADEDGKIVAPFAPSFVALDKKTGKLAWQSNLPGKNTIIGEWSGPAHALVNGAPQVIFAGGDGVIYALTPDAGRLIWKCDCLPKRQARDAQVDNFFLGSPVIVGNRLYISTGIPEGQGKNRKSVPPSCHFLCLDITKRGDVSLKSYDSKSPVNAQSALIWAFGGPIEPQPQKGRGQYFGSTFSTAAVADGLVYIPELEGYLHCLDAATGRRYWEHDLKAGVLGSACCVDGRVMVGTDDGEIVILAQGRTERLLAKIDMESSFNTTPIAANGVLYVMTNDTLYAIAQDKAK